jgi:hypothetical protein
MRLLNSPAMATRMRACAVLAVILMVAGCAAQRQVEAEAAIAQCRATIPAQIGNYVARANCINGVSEQYSSPGDGASALVRATRLSIAVKVDRGELSPEDAGAQLAVVGFLAQQQLAAPNAARAAAAAQLLGATRPAPLEFHPMQVNSGWSASCQTIGTQTYCSGR